jgi:trk system potassium uptake protein TrkH
MNSRTVLWVVGVVLAAVALAQTPALAIALWLGEPWRPFAAAIATGLALAAACILPGRGGARALDHRSAFMAVTCCWLAACALGAVPLLLHPDAQLEPVDALFESVSGLTTTGATVMRGLDALPRSLLFWRSSSQWLGGMGIVLLGIAVFPLLGLGGLQLYKAEAPGPTKDKITPRIAETAKLLWTLYVGLTVVDAALLWVTGVPPFDAICHAMTTVATAGFSTHDASFGHWASPATHLVTAVFMLLGATSFVVLHRALTRGLPWRASPELRAYLAIFAVAAVVVAIDLRLSLPEQFPSAGAAAQHAVFQVASILSTTGHTTRDFGAWPALSLAVLLGLFFVGSMAGSTGGGVKVIRVLLVVQLAFAQFFRLVHPHGVSRVKLGQRTIEDQVLLSALGFFGMWILLLIAGTVLLCGLGEDLLTGFSAAAVSLANIGPGFAGVGPSRTFADLAPAAKLILCALMVLGRLEIYTALVLLTPGFWSR